MAAEPEFKIPVLTDEVEGKSGTSEEGSASADYTIAELQTEIAARTFALTEEIMRRAFAEMEASIFEEVSGRLRAELPEIVDSVLRERLGHDPDY